jgi:uncharacterized damage-inducible protein DinB
MSEILVELFKHNAWANARLLDVCAGLSDEQLDASVPGTYGSVRSTLVHIVGAEASYAARLRSEAPPARLGEATSVSELREHARRSGEALVALAAQTPDEHVLRGTWRDQPYVLPASTVFIQAINHATEHRTQVATILTQQGITPPDLDGWTYGRMQGVPDSSG